MATVDPGAPADGNVPRTNIVVGRGRGGGGQLVQGFDSSSQAVIKNAPNVIANVARNVRILFLWALIFFVVSMPVTPCTAFFCDFVSVQSGIVKEVFMMFVFFSLVFLILRKNG